jgi:hypothetical protein
MTFGDSFRWAYELALRKGGEFVSGTRMVAFDILDRWDVRSPAYKALERNRRDVASANTELSRRVGEYEKVSRGSVQLIQRFRRSLAGARERIGHEVGEHYVASHPKDFVVAVDSHNRVIAATKKAVSRLGYAVGEIIGQDVYTFVDRGSALKTELEMRITQQSHENMTLVDLRVGRDRKKRGVNLVVNPIFIDNPEGDDGIYAGAVLRQETPSEAKERRAVERDVRVAKLAEDRKMAAEIRKRVQQGDGLAAEYLAERRKARS